MPSGKQPMSGRERGCSTSMKPLICSAKRCQHLHMRKDFRELKLCVLPLYTSLS
ncbi:unnamed protein product [Staurois parvus]|uniref:Uncharacterized protein n=1 Tax=Staurois parvus TaxID=386267 RepID=A0ABN9C7C2_9NEOB|nr:unnamed protein product [Staurois parvus]